MLMLIRKIRETSIGQKIKTELKRSAYPKIETSLDSMSS